MKAWRIYSAGPLAKTYREFAPNGETLGAVWNTGKAYKAVVGGEKKEFPYLSQAKRFVECTASGA